MPLCLHKSLAFIGRYLTAVTPDLFSRATQVRSRSGGNALTRAQALINALPLLCAGPGRLAQAAVLQETAVCAAARQQRLRHAAHRTSLWEEVSRRPVTIRPRGMLLSSMQLPPLHTSCQHAQRTFSAVSQGTQGAWR